MFPFATGVVLPCPSATVQLYASAAGNVIVSTSIPVTWPVAFVETLPTTSIVPAYPGEAELVVSLLFVVSWFNVTLPDEPPPFKYVPAVTPVMSPALFVNGKSDTL